MIAKISFSHPKWFVESYLSSASYMKSMAPLRSHQYPARGGAWLRSGAMSSERVNICIIVYVCDWWRYITRVSTGNCVVENQW